MMKSFLLKRLTALWGLVRHDLGTVLYAWRHSQTPAWFKIGTLLLLGYAFSPIDFIPDFIPIFGVMDDLVLIPLALKWLINHLPEAIRQRPTSTDLQSR